MNRSSTYHNDGVRFAKSRKIHAHDREEENRKDNIQGKGERKKRKLEMGPKSTQI